MRYVFAFTLGVVSVMVLCHFLAKQVGSKELGLSGEDEAWLHDALRRL